MPVSRAYDFSPTYFLDLLEDRHRAISCQTCKHPVPEAWVLKKTVENYKSSLRKRVNEFLLSNQYILYRNLVLYALSRSQEFHFGGSSLPHVSNFHRWVSPPHVSNFQTWVSLLHMSNFHMWVSPPLVSNLHMLVSAPDMNVPSTCEQLPHVNVPSTHEQLPHVNFPWTHEQLPHVSVPSTHE